MVVTACVTGSESAGGNPGAGATGLCGRVVVWRSSCVSSSWAGDGGLRAVSVCTGGFALVARVQYLLKRRILYE